MLHIPKAGGTAVREVVQNTSYALGIKMCSNITIPHMIFDSRSYEAVAFCDIVYGHLFFGLIDGYQEHMNPMYATVLRDPVERVLSLYFYVIKYPEHYLVSFDKDLFHGHCAITSQILTLAV